MSRKLSAIAAATLLPLAACSGSWLLDCDGATEEPAELAVEDAELPGETSFAWPAPARFVVTEVAHRRGSRTRARYALETRPAPGGQLEIAIRDYQLLDVDGRPSSDPRLAASARLLRETMGQLVLVVAADGSVIDVRGVGRLTERSLDGLGVDRAGDDGDSVRAAMTSPAAQALLAEALARPWRALVEWWLLDTLPGPDNPIAADDPELGDVEWSLDNAYDDGTIGLRMRATLGGDGDEANALLGAAAGAGNLDADDLAIGRFRTRIVASVVTDPRTLIPRTASVTTRTAVWVDGADQPIERVDRFEYTVGTGSAPPTD